MDVKTVLAEHISPLAVAKVRFHLWKLQMNRFGKAQNIPIRHGRSDLFRAPRQHLLKQ